MIPQKIMFVDDDLDVLKSAEFLLRKAGYDFFAAQSPAEAYSILAVENIDAIFLDLNFSKAKMSGEEGLVCLNEIQRHDPDAIVLVVTGHSGLNVAIQALRAGAHNFIMKPWNNERLLESLTDAFKQQELKRSRPVGSDYSLAGEGEPVLGECEAIIRVKELMARYAPLTATILLVGEVGTGKSLVARTFHRLSKRSNLKVIEGGLLSIADLENLNDTTVVIENIDRLESHSHAPLMDWLQSAARNNNRIIATSRREDLELGLDRSLLYALSTLEMTLPPLSERADDIDLLAGHFSRVFALRQGLALRPLGTDVVTCLRSAAWNDNLHALRRVMERAVATSTGAVISPTDIVLPTAPPQSASALGLSLERTEKYVIEEALKRNNFNVSKAANDLGLTRQTLYRRMVRHGLSSCHCESGCRWRHCRRCGIRLCGGPRRVMGKLGCGRGRRFRLRLSSSASISRPVRASDAT